MIETHIISGSISGKKRHSQGICPVSTDDFQRIDSVSQGLTHLSSLIVSHQTVDQYLLKRCLSGLLNSGEYHSDYPEENDVIAGNQHIRRIEILVILRLLRPAQSLKGPKGTGEPGIQGILILTKGGTLTLWTTFRLFQGYDQLPAVLTIVSGNTMSPPKLTGNTPVLDIFQPMQVGLSVVFRNKFQISLVQCFDSRLCQLFHLHKPLGLHHRLNGGSATIMHTYIVTVGHYLL